MGSDVGSSSRGLMKAMARRRRGSVAIPPLTSARVGIYWILEWIILILRRTRKATQSDSTIKSVTWFVLNENRAGYEYSFKQSHSYFPVHSVCGVVLDADLGLFRR